MGYGKTWLLVGITVLSSWTSWVYAASPQINNAPVLTGTVGEHYTYDLGATDADNDISHYSLYVNPHHPDIQISSTGVITWNLDEHNDAGKYFIVANVRDDENNSDDVRYHLTINDPNNRDPIINNLPVTEATVGVPYRYDLGATDADGDTLRYSLYVWPSNPGITLSEDGVVNWTPTEHNQAGEYSVTVWVYDDNNGSNLVRYKLNAFDPNNHIPVINNTPELTATIGVPYTFDVGATDADGDTLMYFLYHWPSSADSHLSQDGIFTWTPAADDMIGRHAVTITVNDGNNGVETLRYQIDLMTSTDIDGDGILNEEDPFPEDPTNGADLNWQFCSNHGEDCDLTVPSLVRYGSDGNYFYQQVDSFSVWCHDSIFGLIYGSRHCDYLLSDTEDYDGDGVVDSADAFPSDATETQDADGDGLGDNIDPAPSDASNTLNGFWQQCANEWLVCSVPVPTLVRYGDHSGIQSEAEFVYKQVTGQVSCTKDTFNFTGYISNGSCSYYVSNTADYDGDGVVDSVDVFPTDPTETIDTDSDNLGDNADPFPTDANNDNDNANWLYCSDEGQGCEVPVPVTVRYGANGQYFFTYVTDSVNCNNLTFGDPIGHVFKHCDYFLSATSDFDNDGLVDNVDPYPADSENNIASTHWVHCANENEVCSVLSQSLLRYGVEGNYHFQMTDNNTICNDANFGVQSQPEQVNSCDYFQLAPVITNEKKQGWFEIGTETTQSYAASISLDKNNVPYVAYSDDKYRANIFVKWLNGELWEVVGGESFEPEYSQDFVAGERITQSFFVNANTDAPYVMYSGEIQGANKKIIGVKRFNSPVWEVVDSAALSIDEIRYITIGSNNKHIPYVAYIDGNQIDSTTIENPNIIIKQFNGSTWQSVGVEDPIDNALIRDFSLVVDNNNTPYMAYRVFGDYAAEMIIKRFNGTAWERIGDQDLLNADVINFSMNVDNNNKFSIIYRTQGSLAGPFFKQFDGEKWSDLVSPGLSFDLYSFLNVDDENRFYLGDKNQYSLYPELHEKDIKVFDGESWKTLTEQGFVDEQFYNLSMRIGTNNVIYIAYAPDSLVDRSQQQVIIKSFYNGSIYHNVLGRQALAIDINATDADGGQLYYSLVDSYDASLFSIDENTGVVTFKIIPSFENPQDANQDNTYTFEVNVANESGYSTVQKVNINVLTLYKPTLTVIPEKTNADITPVEVNGQPNSQVFVNGLDTGIVLDGNGLATVELDTSGVDGEKQFLLVLKDQLDNESEALEIVITKDTVPPEAPTLAGVPKITAEDTVAIGVYGEVGSQVFVNGVDSGEVIIITGVVSVVLNTSGDYGAKDFAITLQDSFGNISDAVSIRINKQLAPPVITNEKKQGWLDVGNEELLLAANRSSATSITVNKNNIPYIAYADVQHSNKITVKRFNGIVWETVGFEGFSDYGVSSSSIKVDNNNIPYVVYSGVIKRFINEAWEVVGSEETTMFPQSIFFDNNNVPYIAYIDYQNLDDVAVKRLNGNIWETVGAESPSADIDRASSPSLVFDSNNIPYVIYKNRIDSDHDDTVTHKIVVKKLNGLVWENVGEEPVTDENIFSVAMDMGSNNTPYVFYRDSNKVAVKQFDGNNWVFVGEVNFTGAGKSVSDFSIIIGKNETPYVLYHDYNKAFVQRFNDGSWEFMGESVSSENLVWNYSGNLELSVGGNEELYVVYPESDELEKVVVRRFYDAIYHNIFEDQIVAIDIDATDSYGGLLQYSLIDSYDASLFSIDATNGVVTFNTAPDITNPQDANQDNTYIFEVKVLDEVGVSTIQKVYLAVLRDDAPSLTITPTITSEDAVTVEVNGNEPGEEVFVNSIGTGVTLSADKKATITLDTSGEDGDKNFSITLNQSGSDYFSNSLFVSILKDTTVPELVSGWPANNNIVGLTYTNQLELAYIFTDENGIASIKIYDGQGNDISDSAIIDAHSLVLTLTPEQDGHYSYTVIAEDSLGNQKEVISSFDVIRYAPETVASLPGGLYNEPVEVDLISSSEATIYYSTDGYPPMVGAANTQQGASPIKNIAISSTTNLQYFAIDAAGNKEETKSAVYRFSDIDDYNQSITATYDALNNQVNLSWSNDPDAKEYKVYRVATKLDLEVLQNSKAQQYLAPAAYLLAISSVNSFTDTAISNAANYHYVISKVNAEGIETLVSEPVSVSVEPTNIAADVDDAITRAKNWLYSTQNVDGSWGSNQRLTLLETTSALDALHGVNDNNQYAINKALGQVLGTYADNNDYLARQIFTLSTYKFYTNDKVNKLLSQSHFNDNAINGWGLLKRYKPNALDSALAVKALKTSNTDFKKHIGYDWTFNTNTNVVNEHGYWSLVTGGDTSIYVSAFVYSLLESNVEDYAWITQAQNLDGSFGNGLLDTLGAVLYLELPTGQLNQALAYIISQQSTMGDINNNSYLTALALQALSQGVK